MSKEYSFFEPIKLDARRIPRQSWRHHNYTNSTAYSTSPSTWMTGAHYPFIDIWGVPSWRLTMNIHSLTPLVDGSYY
jgi:hypothetical protein